MKKLFLRISVFGTLFVLNALFIYSIDAYNIFFDSNFIENDYKKVYMTISNEVMPRGNALWNLNEYAKHPYQNIIIGDSRAMGFDTDILKEITNIEYYNFAIPGGNLKTIHDVFWFANERIQLKNVVIQVGFSTYNKKINYDLIKSVNPYLYHPYKMFFKNWFIFDSFKALQYKILNEPVERDTSDNLKLQNENFANWDQLLQKQGYKVLSNYEYPDNYYAALKEISEYCKQNNINLQFVILPCHPDYYRIIEEMEMSNYRERFIRDINEMGKTFDYSSTENRITNKMSFIDLYHIKHSIIDSLTYKIWK